LITTSQFNGDRALGARSQKVLLVDPSLFTAPYDLALSKGLEANGLRATWATRGLRDNEEDLLDGRREAGLDFYPVTDGSRRKIRGWKAFKGIEHAMGMRQVYENIRVGDFGIVHFQWLLLPAIDRRFIDRIRCQCPVVVTVHDTEPFNGKAVSTMQRMGLKRALRACDAVIVHTEAGKRALIGAGQVNDTVAVVPHGLLGHHPGNRPATANGRWHIVLVGKLQHYKGVDILIEALGLINPADRAKLRITIAGEAHIPLDPIRTRAQALGLEEDVLSIKSGRLSEDDLNALLHEADAFVFPYRSIEASGVLFLVAGLGRWIIASELGAFIDLVGRDGKNGDLVPPVNAGALAQVLVSSINRKPATDIAAAVPSWSEIGRRTLAVYDAAIDHWRWSRASAAA
jgi:glycosyltransferase involved in cell wall biosynthesis